MKNDVIDGWTYLAAWVEAYNEFVGTISVSLGSRKTAPFEETSEWWRAVVNTV